MGFHGVDRARCNYHLCRLKTRLIRCRFCRNFYCYDHSKAFVPQRGPTGGEISGHPCAKFYDFLKSQDVQQEDRYAVALDRLLKNAPPYDQRRRFRYRRSFNHPNSFSRSHFEKRRNYYTKEIFVGVIMVLAILYLFKINIFPQNSTIPVVLNCSAKERLYEGSCVPNISCKDGTLHPECAKDGQYQCLNGVLVSKASICGCPNELDLEGDYCLPKPPKPESCKDGTLYDKCSRNKPDFCDSGNLLKKPDICGCPSGYKVYKDECLDSGLVESIERTDYLNKIRAKYDRKPVKWDQKLYELAIYRSKDMYERKYFDHVTPDGKCVKDFKKDFGLSSYTIAENAGASAYSLDKNNMEYANYANVNDQIDGWLTSRGHRYNLLYAAHILGVAACYKGACVFLGAHKDPDGFGAGPCNTGDEGMAYWRSAEKQPGEV